MDGYAVLRTEWAPADPEVLAPILMQMLGLVRYDALRMANAAQGIVAEHLTADQASALTARCAAADLPCRVVAESALATVGIPTLVRAVAIDADGLGVVLGYTGGERRFPWAALRLLSAGVIEEHTGRAAAPRRRRRKVGFGSRMALGALVGPLGGLIAKQMEKRMNEADKSVRGTLRASVVEMADLFLEDPEGGDMVHLRLRGPDLYYGQILGDERAGDPGLDFRAVLARLAQFATTAIVSDSLRALVFGGSDPDVDLRDAEFASPHELAQYNVWQLQMALSDAD